MLYTQKYYIKYARILYFRAVQLVAFEPHPAPEELNYGS